jgi:hypothetical protein
MRRKLAWSAGMTIGLLASAAGAATTGTIGLRGVVTSRALVQVAAFPAGADESSLISPGGMTITFAKDRPGSVILHLTGLANSASGFVVSLGAESAAQGTGLALTADDGSKLPYEVRFGGQRLDPARGDIQLASVTRQTERKDDVFEIIAPPIPPGKAANFRDHLTLTIAAR